MNNAKLQSAIAAFVKNKKANAAYYDDNWTERKERKAYYQSFTKDKLLAMTEEDFFEYISRLWSMLIWGNKKYVVDKLIADNGFDTLKKQLAELLYGTAPIEKRWNAFLKSVKGMGPSPISELLTYTNPNEYILFNKTTILCYSYLDVPDMPKYNYQYTGKKFTEVCAIAKEISAALKAAGAEDYDLLAVDYFLWDEVLPLAEKKEPGNQIYRFLTGGYKAVNLIPDRPQVTGNYFCTWDAQCDHMYTWKERPADRFARDAMNEGFLFGEHGLLNSFQGVREDLIVVLDDGWDVPYGAKDSRVFGSLEADVERFPSLRGLSPALRLKKLSERIKAMGYRGLGIWVPSQSQLLLNGQEITRTPQEERLYWEERAKWCHEAGILYLKVDWGAHSGDVEYRKMMTECVRKYAPGLSIEHAFINRPLFEENGPGVPEEMEKYLEEVLSVSDYLRTYDVCHELKYASTVDRAAICLKAAHACGSDAILNIEDTALIGAALGCAIGVMRHDLERQRKYVPLLPRLVSETVTALRWQRIAPPFEAGRARLLVSEERLKDVWHCPQRSPGLWPDVPEGDYHVTAPAAIARNMPLPEVFAKGEKPFVLCSIHPDNGALCVAATPRTFPSGVDRMPLAAVCVQGGSADAPVGVFGRFSSLCVDFDRPVEKRRVYAQNLLLDTAEDVTEKIALSSNRLRIPGELMLQIGAPQAPESGIPAIVLKLVEP